jgi:cysteine desulfuration protein SufE
MADIDEIIGNFAILDDWDDRYRYLIELGRELPPLAEAAHSDANKVQGCASQAGSIPLCALMAPAARC